MVINSLEEVIRLLGTWDITTIRASMGMYLLCKADVYKRQGRYSDRCSGGRDR